MFVKTIKIKKKKKKVYFTKSCQLIWVRVKQPFTLFIHHIGGERVLWGAVFIMQTSDKMQYFTICLDKLHLFNIQDHRSTRGLLAKPFKKFPKSPIRPAGSLFWQAPYLSWTLKESRFNIIKNLLYLFFISWFYNDVILKNVWYARHFEDSCKRCLWTTENKRQSD